MKDKILKLLGSGLAPSVVSSAVGCDPSYVSRLLADQDFALEVAKLRCAEVEKGILTDEKYDLLENKLLEKLENVLTFMVRPRDILEAIRVINAAKRRATPGLVAESGPSKIINLTIPIAVVAKFQLNGTGEVVEIEGRTLTNLPAATLMKSLETKKAENEQRSAPPLKLGVEQAKRAIITEDHV